MSACGEGWYGILSMLSSSWLFSGRESQGERCVGNPPPQGVLGPRIGTRGLMPFGETTKMHNLEPCLLCGNTHPCFVEKQLEKLLVKEVSTFI